MVDWTQIGTMLALSIPVSAAWGLRQVLRFVEHFDVECKRQEIYENLTPDAAKHLIQQKIVLLQDKRRWALQTRPAMWPWTARACEREIERLYEDAAILESDETVKVSGRPMPGRGVLW